jgi:uncharacterized protein (DUF488 family)
LIALARTPTAATMCAEAQWWQCHRCIISDHLLIASIDVVHILGPDETKPAELTPGAEPRADSTIHYPPAQRRLL